MGSFQTHPALTAAATLGVVAAAAYLLAFVGRVFHGPIRADLRSVPDLRLREYAILAPLVVIILWVGLVPGPLLDRSEATVRALLRAPAASVPNATRTALRP